MEKLLTAKQVSELLEVKVSTIYDWVYRDMIPFIKLGRLIRFKKAEIFRWIESHEVHPKSEKGKKRMGQTKDLQKEFPL